MGPVFAVFSLKKCINTVIGLVFYWPQRTPDPPERWDARPAFALLCRDVLQFLPGRRHRRCRVAAGIARVRAHPLPPEPPLRGSPDGLDELRCGGPPVNRV